MEVARAKELRRKIQEDLEDFRSDVEQGKIWLRVSKDEAFRQAIAKTIVKESNPWYTAVDHVADPIEGKIYCKYSQEWPDNINWRMVFIRDLIAAGDYTPVEGEDEAIARVLQNIKDEVIIDLGAKQ